MSNADFYRNDFPSDSHANQKPKRKPKRIAWRRRLLLSLVALGLVAGAIAAYYVPQFSGYNCLRYRVGVSYERALNIQTGQRASVLRSQTPPDNSSQETISQQFYWGSSNDSLVYESAFPSPDGSLTAVLRIQQPFWKYPEIKNTLFIKPTGSEHQTEIQQFVVDFAWLPDRQHIAYTWRDNQSGDLFLVVQTPDGREKKSKLLNELTSPERRRVWGRAVYYGNSTPYSAYYLSPDGAYLARVQYAESTGKSKDASIAVIAVQQYLDGSADEKIVAARIKNNGLIRWSPGSRAFAYLYPTSDRRINLSVISVDGTTLIDSVYLPMEWSGAEAIVPARWSPDGRALLMLRSDDPGSMDYWLGNTITIRSGDLVLFHLDDKRYETLATNLIRRPFFSFENLPFYAYDSPQTERLFVAWRNDDGITAEMMDMNGQHRIKLVENAETIGEPFWLADGKTLVFTWRKSRQIGERMTSPTYGLTWMRIDEDKPHTLEDNSLGFENLVVFPDGRSAAYTLWRASRRTIEKLDFQTEERVVLAEGLDEVSDITVSSQTNTLIFWGRKAGTVGAGVYHFGTKQTFFYRVSGPIYGGGKIYPSADWQFAAVAVDSYTKIGRKIPTSLFFSPLNASPVPLKSGRNIGFGKMLISPDRSRVALSYMDESNPLQTVSILDVYTAQGQFMQRFERAGTWGYPELRWGQCIESVGR